MYISTHMMQSALIVQIILTKLGWAYVTLPGWCNIRAVSKNYFWCLIYQKLFVKLSPVNGGRQNVSEILNSSKFLENIWKSLLTV